MQTLIAFSTIFGWVSHRINQRISLQGLGCDLSSKAIFGRLGFWKLGETNQALIAKFGWRVFSSLESIWVQVAKAKYHCHDLLNLPGLRGHESGSGKAFWGLCHSLLVVCVFYHGGVKLFGYARIHGFLLLLAFNLCRGRAQTIWLRSRWYVILLTWLQRSGIGS